MDPNQQQEGADEPPKPKKKHYKQYGDPANADMQVPKSTVWRLNNIHEEVPVKRAKFGDVANQNNDWGPNVTINSGEGQDHLTNRLVRQADSSPTEMDTENYDSDHSDENPTDKSEAGDNTSRADSFARQRSESVLGQRISDVEVNHEQDQQDVNTSFAYASEGHKSESDEDSLKDDSSVKNSENSESEKEYSTNSSSEADREVYSCSRERQTRSEPQTSSSYGGHPRDRVTGQSLSAESMTAVGASLHEDGDGTNSFPVSPLEPEILSQENDDTRANNQENPSSSESSESEDENTHPVEDPNNGGDVGFFSDFGDSDEEEEQAEPPPPPRELQPPEQPYDEEGDHEHPPPEQPNHPPPYHLLRTKLTGEYSETIPNRVAASHGEMLLNIQEYFKRHPMPLTAQEDLHKLFNSMFYSEVLPESTYKLDKLYGSSNKAQYFFYCSSCSENLGNLDHKALREINCPVCGTNNVIYDLTKAHYFVLLDFVQQLQLLLENGEVASQLKNPNEFEDNGEFLKDLHDGLMYKKFVETLDFSNGRFYITFTVCTDGTPPFSSGGLSIWPIFVMINELPKHIRMSNILLAGLWFGRKHPKMDLFLEPFAAKVRVLSLQGFTLNVLGEARLYFGFLIAVCADSGARGAIQCVHAHNGECPCNWCLHPGEVEGDGSTARKFLQLPVQPEERTHQQMIRDGQAVLQMPGDKNNVNGVIGISPLLRCPKFDIVHGMVVDNLHWASFGVARRMGKLWLGETKKKKKKQQQPQLPIRMPKYYVGSDETKSVINARIRKLQPPREVRRLPREVSQVNDYNAREWENFILYFSIPIFMNILPSKYIKHWTLFVQAFYLVMKADLTKGEADVAGILMQKYVDEVEQLYGQKELTFNMHLSLHAKDNALRWANGSCISTYAFENGNKELKKKIHAERGLAHQLLRSLDRDSSLSILRSLASTPQSAAFRSSIERKEVKKCIFAGSVRGMMPKSFSPTAEEQWHCDQLHIDATQFSECKRILSENVCYSIHNGKSRTDNSYACCNDGSIVKIRKIIVCEMSGEVYLFVSKVRCSPCTLSRNVTVANFAPYMFIVNLVERGSIAISCKDLKTICVNIVVNDRFLKQHFISIMSNTSNVF